MILRERGYGEIFQKLIHLGSEAAYQFVWGLKAAKVCADKRVYLTATVPGQTLERGKGRNQVAASIKEQNCDRQINKIYRDKMVAYLSSFLWNSRAGLERLVPLFY